MTTKFKTVRNIWLTSLWIEVLIIYQRDLYLQRQGNLLITVVQGSEVATKHEQQNSEFIKNNSKTKLKEDLKLQISNDILILDQQLPSVLLEEKRNK